LGAVTAAVGNRVGQFGYIATADADNNGVIDLRDVTALARVMPAGTKFN
jgi:hypothetical protein